MTKFNIYVFITIMGRYHCWWTILCLVPEGIIRPVLRISALTRYIFNWNLQFLNKHYFNKGSPASGIGDLRRFWLYYLGPLDFFLPKTFLKYLAFLIFDLFRTRVVCIRIDIYVFIFLLLLKFDRSLTKIQFMYSTLENITYKFVFLLGCKASRNEKKCHGPFSGYRNFTPGRGINNTLKFSLYL